MKRILTMTTALTMLGSTAAIAAPMPEVIFPFPNVSSERNVTQELHELGFDHIVDYEQEGNVISTITTWEGDFAALKIDEQTGRITERYHPDVAELNLARDPSEAALIAAFEERGYTVIGDMEREADLYVVKVERADTVSYIYIEPNSGNYIDTAMVDREYVPVVDTWTEAYVRTQLAGLGFENVDVGGTSGKMVVAQGFRDGEPVTITVDKQTGAIYVAS